MDWIFSKYSNFNGYPLSGYPISAKNDLGRADHITYTFENFEYPLRAEDYIS